MHLPAQPDAPIACDMSTASDSPDERLAAYARLFESALVRRQRAVVFTFRRTPKTLETVEDLARREAACCPFLDYRVETAGDEIIWTITSPVTAGDTTLDAFYALPDHPGSNFAALRWSPVPAGESSDADERTDDAGDRRSGEARERHQRAEPHDRACPRG